MPTRRAVLAGAGVAITGTLAGCSGRSAGGDEPPAGSLRLTNRDTLPHEIRVAITDVGTARGETGHGVTGDPEIPGDPGFVTTATLQPDTSETYESAYPLAIWYAVEIRIDDRADRADTVAFNPVPDDAERGRYFGATAGNGGGLGWSIAATDDPGTFTV